MNCQQAQDLLLDLVYEELDAASRQAVEAHAGQCAACREELARLRRGRAAMASLRACEPVGGDIAELCGAGVSPAQPSHEASSQHEQPPRQQQLSPSSEFLLLRPRFLRWRRLAVGMAAAAALAVLVIAAWLIQERTTTQVFATGRVEIKRMNVSLTIMSTPQWAGNWMPQQQAQVEPTGGYVSPSQWQGLPPGQWQGLALVRDERMIRNLNRGLSEIAFTDVPSGIQADTVRLRSLDAPGGLTILEQNYQYDLASAAAVLKKHIDKNIAVVYKDGKTAAGRLLSFDDSTLVLQPSQSNQVQTETLPAGTVNIARQEIQAITFEKLPEGLLSRPTLVWKLQNEAALQQQFEVAYMTSGLSWRADYLLKIQPVRGKTGGGDATRPSSETLAGRMPAPLLDIIDSAEMVGYATVSNTSGVTYQDAQLKLMAGDVNILRQSFQWTMLFDRAGGGHGSKQAAEPFQEKSFFEYHLYTLGQPTTLRHNETKQIQLVSGEGIKLRRAYVYDPADNPTAARVVSEMKNSKDNGLGRPLPKGVIRLYAPDDDGQETYVAQTTIDHTPADETLRLPWGYAFDIACSARQTVNDVRGPDRREVWEYSLRNHKDADVNVTIIVHVPAETYTAKTKGNQPWHVREVGVVEIPVAVKANSQAVVEFLFSHDGLSGGGLKSPYNEAVKKR